jgi:cell wall-associated NlpC family hydrolase
MRRTWDGQRHAASRLAPAVALVLALGVSGGAVVVGTAQADNNSSTAPGEPLQGGGGFVPPKPTAEPPKAAQAGGGNLPGVKPTSDAEPSPVTQSDALPPLDPNFVDNYSNVWKAIQKGKAKIVSLGRGLRTARATMADSVGDQAIAFREDSKAQVGLAQAQAEFASAVRGLYISGTTDVDMILGVMGSKPDDVLRNIDSFVYLRAATGSENGDYALAQQHATEVESAVAAAQIRSDQDATLVDGLVTDMAATRKKLKIDEKELQRLISAAAPQTVVSKDGCPKAVLVGTVPEGIPVKKLCGNAVRHAATPQAAVAIKWAMVRLGAPYACEGIGRLEAWRYDCSSYVARAYSEGAGLGTAGLTWAPSTRNMVPWDGVPLDQHYAPIPPSELHPGDLVLYDTCPAGETCPYRHVVMYLGPMEKGGVPMMAHTNGCGLVAHVEPFLGTDVANFLGVRRVVALKGEKVQVAVARVVKPKKP